MFGLLQFLVSLYSLLLYGYLRNGIYSHLRLRKISKTAIGKHQKGFRNYWFYRDIQKDYGLGILYSVNMSYLWMWLIHHSLLPLAALWSWLKQLLLIYSCFLCLLQIPAVIIASVNVYREEFGTAFVLLAKDRKTGKLRSSLFELLAWAGTAFLVYLSYRGLAE